MMTPVEHWKFQLCMMCVACILLSLIWFYPEALRNVLNNCGLALYVMAISLPEY